MLRISTVNDKYAQNAQDVCPVFLIVSKQSLMCCTEKV